MESKTLGRVLNWFKEYQGDGDRKQLFELYSQELFKEEFEETKEAIKEHNLVEVLDGIGDVIWVSLGALYFNDSLNYNDITTKYNNLITEFTDFMNRVLSYEGDANNILDELINAIADSNYTKSKETVGEGNKKGKIIKGENFVPPTEDIKKIIKKYNIKFKENMDIEL